MENGILNGGNSASAIAKSILKGFTNLDEVVKTKEQERIEKAISDGSIKVVTVEDIKKEYGGIYVTPANYSKMESDLNATLKKGEDDHLEEEEFDALEKAQKEFDSLEEVIVKGNSEDGKPFSARVYVLKHAEVTEGAEGSEGEDSAE